MNGISILIADNSARFAELLKIFLEYRGFSVTGIADDGEKALQFLQKASPDVILLDLIMPQIDGFGVLREVALMNNKPRIIVMSGLESDDIKQQTLSLGAERYFIKPFSVEALAFCLNNPPEVQTEDSHPEGGPLL